MLRKYLPLFLLLACGCVLAEAELDITGADRNLEDNIRHHIGALADSELQQPRVLRRKLKAAVEEGARALGYYEIQHHYSVKKNTLLLELEPGPVVRWAAPDIRIDGTALSVDAISKMVQKPPFKAGQAINHRSYENYKRDLLELCQEYGFLDARLEHSRLLVDLQSHTAIAAIAIASGPRYVVNEIRFDGSKLDPALLARLSPMRAGGFYRKKDLTQLQRDLQSSSYFRDIEVQTDRIEGDRLLVQVRLNDAPSHEFGIGVGFGTDTGPRTKLRWEQPHATRSGHQVNTELSISQPQQDWNATYRIPLSKPLQQSINFTTRWQHKSVEDTSSTVGSVGFFYSDRYRNDWVANYGVDYDDESYRQGSEPRKHVRYAIPGMNFTQVVLPPGIDPTSGHRTWLALTASAPQLGADTAFLRFNAGYKRLFDLSRQQLLVGRVEIGAIATDNILEMPSSQRFFTGGDQTVRGYDFESLSSVDANGELIGGRYLNVASLEYSAKVAEQWRVALFTDTGRAFNNLDEEWHSSAGFGVRWLSPVGQIRVDIAFPIGTEERSWRLHIFMGPPL